MLHPRGLGFPCALALFGRTVRLLVLAVATFASAFLTTASGQSPATVGSWSPVWDWNCDTQTLGGEPIKLQHGALIPQGAYRGCVLLFGEYSTTTRTFLWMPSDPDRLYHVPSGGTFATAGRDVDGISMTWDDEGQLVLVGSMTSSPTPGNDTWRFLPGGLHFPPIKTLNNPCIQSSAQVNGGPWRLNASVMSVARYQATILALCRGPINGGIASASTFVLGGTTSASVNDGLEFWQALSPRSTPGGSAWSQTFVSNLVSPPHAPPGPNIEQYAVQVGLPEVQHETTPAALQLSSAGTGANRFTKSVFVAHDSDVAYVQTPAPSDVMGRSWVVRPRYDALPATWQLWAGGLAFSDRNQGTTVLRHDLAGTPPNFTGKNRVIQVGGYYYQPHPTDPAWWMAPYISEYWIQPNTDPTTGSWLDYAIPPVGAQIGRVNNSAVVLPTGDILVVGGGIFAEPANIPSAGTPQFTPQLVRPGLAGALASAWSVTSMAPSPVLQGAGQISRLRGHASVLLPDGRVLVSGGEQPTTPGLSFTGEVFTPPYLFQSFRPSIVSVSASELDFGQSFDLYAGRGEAEVIDAVVLLRPASTAFGFDTSQRYIELMFQPVPDSYSGGVEQLTVLAPNDDLGPPGHYLLFVVSHLSSAPSNRVPSEGQFVRLKP